MGLNQAFETFWLLRICMDTGRGKEIASVSTVHLRHFATDLLAQ